MYLTNQKFVRHLICLKGRSSSQLRDAAKFHLPNYEKQNHSRYNVPNISGRWKSYDNIYLAQPTPDSEVSLKDIKDIGYIDTTIEQKRILFHI